MSSERFNKAIEEIENALEDIKEEYERTLPQRAQDSLWYAKNGVVSAVRAYLAARADVERIIQLGRAPSESDMAAMCQAESDMAYHLKQVDALETLAHAHTNAAPAPNVPDAGVRDE